MAASSAFRELQHDLETQANALSKIQKDIAKNHQVRKQYTIQLGENELVIKELDLLDEGANIYKLIGPVLVKQDLAEARANVRKRIEYISAELKRLEGTLQDLEDKQKSKHEAKLVPKQLFLRIGLSPDTERKGGTAKQRCQKKRNLRRWRQGNARNIVQDLIFSIANSRSGALLGNKQDATIDPKHYFDSIQRAIRGYKIAKSANQLLESQLQQFLAPIESLAITGAFKTVPSAQTTTWRPSLIHSHTFSRAQISQGGNVLLNIHVKVHVVLVIFDLESQKNLISEKLIEKLKLETKLNPEPYTGKTWVQNDKTVHLQVCDNRTVHRCRNKSRRKCSA